MSTADWRSRSIFSLLRVVEREQDRVASVRLCILVGVIIFSAPAPSLSPPPSNGPMPTHSSITRSEKSD